MKFIDSDVLKIAYFDHGPVDGQPVVLLHGFPYDISAYDEVVKILTAAGMRCFVPYLRGYGPTRFLDNASPRSGEQAALGADLIAFISALGISSPIVAGYDWGGRAACVAAALWPERIHGLVSCGTGYNIQNIGSASSLQIQRQSIASGTSIISIAKGVTPHSKMIEMSSANIFGRHGHLLGVLPLKILHVPLGRSVIQIL